MFYVIKIKTIKKKNVRKLHRSDVMQVATYASACRIYGAINEYSGIINSHAC